MSELEEVEKPKKTKVFKEEFKGKPLFCVYEINDSGEKIKDRPVVSFGLTKAKALSKHVEELKKFVEGE